MLRSDPDTDFLSFSLSDGLDELPVLALESAAARSSLSAAQFADASLDLKRIAHDADVDMVLTGMLLRSEKAARQRAAGEAPVGSVLWSQTSEAPVGDIFALQDESTQRIVESHPYRSPRGDHRLLRHDVPASAKANQVLSARKIRLPTRRGIGRSRDLYLNFSSTIRTMRRPELASGASIACSASTSSSRARPTISHAGGCFRAGARTESDLSLGA